MSSPLSSHSQTPSPVADHSPSKSVVTNVAGSNGTSINAKQDENPKGNYQPVDSHPAGRDQAHKRRRISRACDDCRRKKIKCDGKQPCSSCAEFNSACTYRVPSRRTKRPTQATPTSDPQVLEARLRAATAIIQRFLPQLDLDCLDATAPSPNLGQTESPATRNDELAASAQASPSEPPAADTDRWIPMVEGQDQLRFTDNGDVDFHGLSSGAAFLSHFTQHFPELLRHDSRIPFLPQATRLNLPSGLPMTVAASSSYNYTKLPPRHLARMLCEYSFKHASSLLRIVHVPSFYKRFDALYDGQSVGSAQDRDRYMGLLYSILALGSMYDVDENDPSNPDHYDEAISRGSVLDKS
jgi:hypothetical protein